MISFSKETLAPNGWMEKEARLGKLIVYLVKSPKAPQSAEFLPSKVMKDNKVIWDFDNSYVGCHAFLREHDNELLIVYTTRTEIVNIVPLTALENAIRLADGDYDYQISALQLLRLKLALAEKMNRDPRLSPVERILKAKLEAETRKLAEANIAAIKAAQGAERQAVIDRRTERKRLLMNRPNITVYTGTGDKKSGRPMVGDEWQSLGHGTDCVSVDSYKDGVLGEVREHFFVNVSSGGKKSKARIVAVTREDPAKPKLIEKMGEVAVERNGELDAIALYTREGLNALKTSGLNSGAVRGVSPLNDDGTVTLVMFVKTGIKDIGKFQPLG